MPSPFPGMDPFIESQKWLDFHTSLLLALRRALVPLVRPRYVVDVEKHVYLVKDPEASDTMQKADVAIYRSEATWPVVPESPPLAAVGVVLEPVVRQTPVPDQYEQTFLEIRTHDGAEVVTTIEVLSPWNKQPGAGRTEYWTKRQNVFAAPANLVEIDLLRGGSRIPTTVPLPAGDYFAFVSRPQRFPNLDVFAWSLRDRLPQIPIPLAANEADVSVDLQAALSSIYDEAGYDYSLNYRAEVAPLLTGDDLRWVAEKLTQAGRIA